jgi:acyl-CoA dehydrogenase
MLSAAPSRRDRSAGRSIAEAARDIALAQALKRRSPAIDTVGEMETELASARIACDALVAFSETATPGPETTNKAFMYRALVGRSAVRTVDLAMDVAGGAAYFRRVGPGASVPGCAGRALPSAAGQRATPDGGRAALGMPIDDVAA